MFEIERPQLTTLRAQATGLLAKMRRSRTSRLAVTIIVGVVVGTWLTGLHQNATQRQQQWQTEISGWVATRDLIAGSTLGAGDVAATRLLKSGSPRDATISNPEGLTLRDAMAEGEIVRDGRLSSKKSELAAQIANKYGALTIPNDGTPLANGDLVDLYALIDGNLLATNTKVVNTEQGFVTLAIAETQIRPVIVSLTTGGVVPVLVG